MITLNSRPITVKGLQKALILPKTFSEAHIDIRECLDENIYLLSNGDLGVVYELSGIYDEILTEGELADQIYPIYKAIRSLCSNIPNHEEYQNTVLQLICSQRGISKTRIKPSENSLAEEIIENEEDYLLSIGLVKRRFYLAVRFSPISNVKSFWQNALEAGLDFTKQPKSILNEKWQSIYKNYEQLNQTLKPIELEIGSKISLRRLEQKELIYYFENILHGAADQKLAFEVDRNIHESIYNPCFESKSDGLYLKEENKKAIKCMFLESLPLGFRLGSLKTFLDSLPVQDFDLVWCFSHGKKKPSQELAVKASWFERGPAHRSKYEDVVNFQSKVEPLSPYGIQSLRLLMYEDNKEIEAVIKGLSIDILESRLVLEDQIPIHMIATSLPLCCSKEAHKVMGRYSTIRLENAAMFFPIYDGPQGKNGSRFWVSRNGVPIKFDLFEFTIYNYIYKY